MICQLIMCEWDVHVIQAQLAGSHLNFSCTRVWATKLNTGSSLDILVR